MSRARTTLRLAAFVIGTAALLFFALGAVPATTLGVQGRMMVFVLVVPWLMALLVAHPRRVAGTLATLATGRGDEGLATARTLDLIGGLTVAVGAVGAFGTFALVQFAVVDNKDASSPSDVRSAVALAMAVAPAFALLVRFVLYEPVIVSIRRRHAAEGETPEGRPVMHTGWKVIIVVVATVLAVEGFRALFLRPPPKVEKPPRDTSFLVVGTNHDDGGQSPDLGPDHPSAGPPIRVEITRGEDGISCLVDGKPLAAVPGQADELHERLRALKAEEESRRIEIVAGLEVPFGHVLAAVDACNRCPVPGWAKVGVLSGGRVRIVTPYGPFPYALRCRMVHEVYGKGVDLVHLDLPFVADVEKVVVESRDGARNLNIAHDAEYGISEVYVKRDLCTLDEAKAWIHRYASIERDAATGVSALEFTIRCDAGAPVRKAFELLAIFTDPDILVRDVRFAVGAPRDETVRSGLTLE